MSLSAQRLGPSRSCSRATLSLIHSLWHLLLHALPFLTVVSYLPSRHFLLSLTIFLSPDVILGDSTWITHCGDFFDVFLLPVCLVLPPTTYFPVQSSPHPRHLNHPLPKSWDCPLALSLARVPAGTTELSSCPEPILTCLGISPQCNKRLVAL